MKVSILIIALISFSASAIAIAADQFPGGSYRGGGNWKELGSQGGAYSVQTTIEDNKICSNYSWKGGTSKFCFEADFEKDGFFTTRGGWGYCYDYQCHYEINEDGIMIEETLSFIDDNLYKVGSKQSTSRLRTVWQESLKLTSK